MLAACKPWPTLGMLPKKPAAMASPPEPGAEASEQDGASEASRGVWSGTVDELVAILELAATGISFCSYPDERALVMKATLDVDATCEH